MALSELPTELVRDIADFLDTEKDVLLFAQLSRQFLDILVDYLYARNAKRSNASALLWAAKHGYESTARQALANGANPSATNRKGDTSLHLATNAGNLSMVQFLLNAGGVDINQQNKYLETPLIAPAREGNEDLVKFLLDQPGIDPDMSDRSRIRPPRLFGQTPLSHAAMNGHVNVLRALLATNRVNIESKDMRGWTPLAYAAAHGQAEAVEALIKVPGIQLKSKTRWGQTPLMLAAMNGHEAVARILIGQESPKGDIERCYGSTALLVAVRHGHENIAKLLLDNACNPYLSCGMNITPPCLAINRGQEEIVKWMQQSEHQPKVPLDPAERDRQMRANVKAIWELEIGSRRCPE
jgi:ankyrin repeat protein